MTKHAPDAPQAEALPADRLAEAGVWVARLHGDGRGPRTEAGFRQWLSAHPLNARAFELVTEVWEESGELRRVVPVAYGSPPRARMERLVPAMLVAVAAVVAVLFFLWPRDIRTDVGEQRQLTLEDGSRIHLNTATQVEVRYTRDRRGIELKRGEALFEVARDPSRPFVVRAGDERVTALGTSFAVRRDPDRTEVLLVTGKVVVEGHWDAPGGTAAANDATLVLRPGQRLTVAGRQLAARLDAPALDSAMAWRRGQVVLKDTPLREAIAEMNRYSPSQLEVEDPDAAALRIDGLFHAGDSASFAKAVALSYGLSVDEHGDRIVLRGKPAAVSGIPR